MPSDHEVAARRVVDGLERSDIAAIRHVLAERLDGWDPVPWIAEQWRPQLDALAGPNRAVTGARQVNDAMARVTLQGDRGQAFVSVLFDEAPKVAGLAIDRDERDGQFWVVIGCTRAQRDDLRDFYAMLTDGPIGYGRAEHSRHAGGIRSTRRRSTSM